MGQLVAFATLWLVIGSGVALAIAYVGGLDGRDPGDNWLLGCAVVIWPIALLLLAVTSLGKAISRFADELRWQKRRRNMKS